MDKHPHIALYEVMRCVCTASETETDSRRFFLRLFALPLLLWAGLSIYPVQTFGVENGEARVVIIDPGHGGEDGGAVADDGTEESGINLAVSLRLEGIFRFLGVPTEMTRREDVMVCDSGLATLRQRKVSDIHNRAALVNQTPGAVLLSIHQNSLPSSPVTHGAQVFWNRPGGGRGPCGTDAGAAERENQYASPKGSEADFRWNLSDESCKRACRAGGVRFPFQWGGGRQPAREDYQTMLAALIAADICVGTAERDSNEVKNIVLLYGMRQ